MRIGNLVAIMVDGVWLGSFAHSDDLGDSTFRIAVGGQDPNAVTGSFNGQLDSYRMTKGEAVYIPGPPTEEFPTS